jgi:predicted O-linked N-acetylglucosamine transferase (SPINDLY family)
MPPEEYSYFLREAIRQHRAGRLAGAEMAYSRAVALRPEEPDPLQMLGVVIAQAGRVDEGEAMIRRAIAMSPKNAGYYANLGYVLAESGRKEEAVAAFAQAVSLNPQDSGARLNLAHALREIGRLDDFVSEYRESFRLKPPSAEMLHEMGATLLKLKMLPEAINCYTQAVQLRPDVLELKDILYSALLDSGRVEEAETIVRQLLALRPNDPSGWFKLGNLLHDQRHFAGAIDAYRKSLNIEPSIAARHNLGSALRGAQRPQEAVEQYQNVVSMGYDGFDLRYHMGLALWDMHESEQAMAWFRRALELKPDPQVESGVIFAQHFFPDVEPASTHAALSHWNENYVRPLSKNIVPHTNDSAPDRRLRVGYVARHLGDHPVGRFLLQLLSHHNRSNVEVFCYCDDGSDAIGTRLREHIEIWRPTLGVSDEQLAEQIRADRIDILVDLMMHCGANRLMTFARKPAPVQVAYLAYPGSTGLETMDYRLTDPFLDPPGNAEEPLYSEKTVRLPHTFWCYLEPGEAPAVGPLPADAAKSVMFGCLNSIRKVNERVAAQWSRILLQMPGSRLTLVAPEGPFRQRPLKMFADHGVAAERLTFVGALSLTDYFAEYNRIDIALDPFPYPGGTTTCDALWMGVPVITLGGPTPISRGGVSILSNLGLEALVTWHPDKYVHTAVNLARDLPAVRSLRSSLRERMGQSTLMNGPQFARDVENAYRLMWSTWCASNVNPCSR